MIRHPYTPARETLQEHNVRTGFFEDHQYETVRAHLPAYAQPVVTFAFITGWRVRSEVLTLQWRQVDFKAGIIRLLSNTPNGDTIWT